MQPSEKVDLLDWGHVRLVDYMGGDLSVVRAARVSYDAAWRAGKDTGSDERLIHRLMRDKHSTPFESVEFQFEVKAPIFVFRQWHRHRTWTYNELSGRYRPLPEEFYLPEAEIIGEQSTENKQGRQPGDPSLVEQRREELKMLEDHCERAFELYRHLLAQGWPRELARIGLPLGTYSHMFGKVNMGNLFKFLKERCDSHAQYEIRVYANAMLELAKQVAPISVAAWQEVHGLA
jgi:thymidylate synthase (FAD)